LRSFPDDSSTWKSPPRSARTDRKRRTNGWTSQAEGVYPGLDRFGRVVRQTWLDGATGSTAAGYRPAIVDQIHTYDLASNRLSKRDGRAGASWAGRDWEYSYDALGRLTEARQGARVVDGGRGCGRSLWCSYRQSEPPQRRALKPRVLDMLGNWSEHRTDLSGNGAFTDALDRLDAREHNLANELSQRKLTAGGTGTTNSVTLPLAYDAAGNLAEESTGASTKRRYTHDAWGRLVKVESVDANDLAKPISTQRFNGLHWRVSKDSHLAPDAQDIADRKTTFWYDAAWRVVQETQRDQTNGAGTLEESVIQQAWGARYIDDAVARLRLTGNGSGGVAAGSTQEIAFQLTDAQFSVIAVATPGKPGVVIDRIAYSPYGEATRTLRSDVNGDGFVNKDDYNGVIRSRLNTTIGSSGYVVEADLDRDGKVAQSDYDIAVADDGKSSSGGVGEAGLFAKGVRNGVGYCGYIFNDESGLYTVRFRSYSPTLGRWLERDPAGYVDGMGLYEYVRGGPIAAVDPWGLVDGRKHHAVCLGLGGSPDQLCIDLGDKDAHIKAHAFLRERLGGGAWDKQRAAFAKLTDKERRELIRGSLVAAGVKKDVLTDDVLDGMFYDFEPGASRKRGPIRHMMDLDGNLLLCDETSGNAKVVRAKGKGGFAAILVLGALGVYSSTADATDRLLSNTGCMKILERMREAMRHKDDPCAFCDHISSIENHWIEQCGIEVMGVGGDIVGDSGGLIAWNSWHRDWKKLKDDCKTVVNTARTGGAVGVCAGGIVGGIRGGAAK